MGLLTVAPLTALCKFKKEIYVGQGAGSVAQPGAESHKGVGTYNHVQQAGTL